MNLISRREAVIRQELDCPNPDSDAEIRDQLRRIVNENGWAAARAVAVRFKVEHLLPAATS